MKGDVNLIFVGVAHDVESSRQSASCLMKPRSDLRVAERMRRPLRGMPPSTPILANTNVVYHEAMERSVCLLHDGVLHETTHHTLTTCLRYQTPNGTMVA